jgi:DNA-binding Lrp family transcriptional regulator
LRRETGIREFHSLPALAVYKIRVEFDLTDDAPVAGAAAPHPAGASAPPTQEQKELVRLIQDGLPIERDPFAAAAARLGWPAARVVRQIREWIAAGVIRRFGAVVRHREIGFQANGMAVFRMPDGEIDAAGRRLAAHREVSHCYRRPPLEGFPYNLFAMVHGRSEEEVRRTVAGMARELGRVGAEHPSYVYDMLFSITEFKKVSMRYFVE